MLFSYLKLSIRLLIRSPYFTLINVAGLSVGFAVFFILWPFTHAELHSDQFIKDHERIARPILDFNWTDDGGETWGHLNIAVATSDMASELRRHPDIEDVTRFVPQSTFAWYTPGRQADLVAEVAKAGQPPSFVKVDRAIIADQNFFTFFGLTFLHGDPVKALEPGDAIVLSEKLSTVFFNEENPVGKTININRKEYIVAGVFKDLPLHSHLHFNAVFSNTSFLNEWNTTPETWMFQYYKMKNNADLLSILTENKERFLGSFLKTYPHIKIEYIVQPLTEVAFSNRYMGDIFKPKSKLMLTALSVVSVVVLLMAWMNYVNLNVSRTKTRLKEIAARKVSGALNSDLFLQFICQSIVINVIAALVGLTIIQVVKTPVNDFLDIQVVELDTTSMIVFSMVLLFGILGTAGYTAWLTSRHSARQLLANDTPSGSGILSTSLTTIQYAAALTLIAWIFVMNEQLSYILNKDLGIERENIVVIESPVVGLEENGIQRLTSFANQLRGSISTIGITQSSKVCGDPPDDISLRPVGAETFFGIDSHGGVDEEFIPTFNLKLIAGRNFTRDERQPSIILSSYATSRLGFKDPHEAVGSFVEFAIGDEWKKLEVIGVIEDYRMKPWFVDEGSTESVTGRGQALVYLNSVRTSYVPRRISLKLDNASPEDISQIEDLYKQAFPGNAFTWYYLDDNINKQYGEQKVARNQITLFTLLAVGVACLGLLGMISNKLSEKVKEMSVRRILGAETHHILKVLLGPTAVQVAIALVVGIPIAWIISRDYLQKYTDHISLQWWHFIVPVAILVLIMTSSVATILWKAASTRPVDALKHE